MQSTAASMPGRVVRTSQAPPFSVPIRYMLLGVLCFGLFAVDFALQSASLAQGQPGAPNVVALTHALTLGALLSFVMGAVYQLTTVAFLTPIASVPAARWNFWLYACSFIGLFISMTRWWGFGLLLFGCGMVVAIYIYATVMIVSLLRTTVRGVMLGFVVSAHAYLILAITAALLLVLVDSGNMPGLAMWMTPLIASHILLALGGYFTFLVMGFSLKLLPMFTLSHGFATHRQKWTLILAHAAIWVMLAGIWGHWSTFLWAGAVIGVAAFANHIRDILDIIKKRMRKRLEPPIRAVITAAVVAVLGLCLFVTHVLWAQGEAGWQEVVMFYMLGVVTLTVMSFAYKIVPFLIWSERYSKPSGKGRPTLISDLINLNGTWLVLIGFVAGLAALTISAAGAWATGVVIGCLVVAASVIVFCVQIIRVLELAKLRRELFAQE